MYPCDWDKPLPVARRTYDYFKSCGMKVAR
jgi:hypothetical protein